MEPLPAAFAPTVLTGGICGEVTGGVTELLSPKPSVEKGPAGAVCCLCVQGLAARSWIPAMGLALHSH